MEPDKNTIKKVLDLDDETLKAKILLLARETGIDANSVTPFFSDMNYLRKMLANLSPSEINRAINMIGKEKSEKILRDLK